MEKLGRTEVNLEVIWRVFPPSALIRKMSDVDSRAESKAIHWLSADHLGLPIRLAPDTVNGIASEPSGRARQISRLPDRVEQKATHSPLGDGCGSSSLREDS